MSSTRAARGRPGRAGACRDTPDERVTRPTPKLPATESVPRKQRAPARGVARLVVTPGPELRQGAPAHAGPRHRRPPPDQRSGARRSARLGGAPRARAAGGGAPARARPRHDQRHLPRPAPRSLEAELGPGALLRLGDSSIRLEVDDRAEPEKGQRGGPLRRPPRRLAGDARALRHARPHRADAAHRPRAGRDRHGQGGAGPRPPRPLRRAAPAPSSSSTPPTSPPRSPRACSSATSAARSPARTPATSAPSSAPTAARSSSTRWASCRSTSSPSSSACSRRARVTRVGGTETIPVDIRLVAATHRDLRAEIDAAPLPRGPLLPPRGGARLPPAPARPPRRHPAARAATSSTSWARPSARSR